MAYIYFGTFFSLPPVYTTRRQKFRNRCNNGLFTRKSELLMNTAYLAVIVCLVRSKSSEIRATVACLHLFRNFHWTFIENQPSRRSQIYNIIPTPLHLFRNFSGHGSLYWDIPFVWAKSSETRATTACLHVKGNINSKFIKAV